MCILPKTKVEEDVWIRSKDKQLEYNKYSKRRTGQEAFESLGLMSSSVVGQPASQSAGTGLTTGPGPVVTRIVLVNVQVYHLFFKIAIKALLWITLSPFPILFCGSWITRIIWINAHSSFIDFYNEKYKYKGHNLYKVSKTW